MNTIEAERLVRRITAILKSEGDPAMAPKLAVDFQAVCSSAALRLEQCRTMIDAGASAQAIQLAETQPNLLDLVTVLEFRQADEWRQYCTTKNLPCAETLPARDVSALNNCYNRGISPQHPVYAAYRAAVLGRNDEEALTALKSIARLNPADANAASELARLDGKLLAGRLAKLDALLDSDPAAAVHELDAIEAFGFKSECSGKIWQRGQMARSGRLLSEAEQFRSEGLLAETVAQLGFLEQLRADHKLAWPLEWETRVGSLRDWCHAESAARQTDAECQAAVAAVGEAIAASEAKDTRAKRASISELRSDLEELHRRFRRLESFAKPVPEDLTLPFQKRSAVIQRKIKLLSLKRTLFTAAASSVAVLLTAIAALAFLGLRHSNFLAAEIKKATATHQVRAMQSLLKQAGGKTILPTPNLKSAVAGAAAALASQTALLAEFEKAFKKLPPDLAGVNSTKQLVDTLGDLNRAEQAQAALGSDLQAETKPELDAFRKRWEGHCANLLPAINKEMDDRISAEESIASALNDMQNLAAFRSGIAEALPKLEQVSQEIATVEPVLKLRPELADRSKALMERLRDYQNRIGKVDAAVANLTQAGKTADLAAAVAELAVVDLKQSDYVRAASKAAAVAALKDDPEALSLSLLVGTNSTLWESYSKAGKNDLIPGKCNYDVRQRFMELTRDYAVNARHFRCRLYHDEKLTDFEEWITDGPLVADATWHSIPGWTVQNDGNCEFGLKEYGAFQGQYKFADNKPAYGVTSADISALTDVWQSSGFAKLMDTRSLTYKLPPLRVVDDIVVADKASPIFKAYLVNNLLRIMATQPLESGLDFSPELRSLPEKLDALGVNQIRSGDWFVPARVSELQSKYAGFFATLQGVSFYKQAFGFLNATKNAMKSGFVMVGYADPDGKPVWRSSPGDSLVWGLSGSASQPGLLFTVRGGETHVVAKPLPLTPLLVFQGDLAAIIRDSGVHPDDPASKGQLPPLFSIPVAAP